jgi:hypothetical protein
MSMRENRILRYIGSEKFLELECRCVEKPHFVAPEGTNQPCIKTSLDNLGIEVLSVNWERMIDLRVIWLLEKAQEKQVWTTMLLK